MFVLYFKDNKIVMKSYEWICNLFFFCVVCFKVFDVNYDGKLCERELV